MATRGFDVRAFCSAFPPASLGRHIKMENSITLEAFKQLKILQGGSIDIILTNRVLLVGSNLFDCNC